MAEVGKTGAPQGEVYFYHMTRTPLEATLPVLLDKSLAAGWKVLLRGRARAQLEWLDQKLWLNEGFLPHGLAGGAHDADQPVLLTTETAPAANDPACLMALSGAEVSVEEAQALARVCVLFDGGDPAAVARARAQWKALTGGGVAAQYWSDESGKWERRA